jgi:uncharacterized protein
MSIPVNIQHLEKGPVSVIDELLPKELDLQSRDELIRFGGPVSFDLEVQKLDESILVQGVVSVQVECDCARCLKTFSKVVDLPQWTIHLALAGDEAVPVINECVDLTPFLREDILLALPQHPLCSRDCKGLMRDHDGGAESRPAKGVVEDQASPWGELDKLDI